MTPEYKGLQCDSSASHRQNHKLCIWTLLCGQVWVWHCRIQGESWPCFLVSTQCGCILFAVQYCCGWSCGTPDWSAGHVVCAVISDVHRTLRSHRSLPLGEMEFVGVCVCVLEKNWLFYFSRTSHLPPPVSLSTHSLQSHEHITWPLPCYFMLCYASPVPCVVYGSQRSGFLVQYTAESSHFCQTCIMFTSSAFNGATWHCLFLQTEDLFNLNLLGCHICTCHTYHIIISTIFDHTDSTSSTLWLGSG